MAEFYLLNCSRYLFFNNLKAFDGEMYVLLLLCFGYEFMLSLVLMNLYLSVLMFNLILQQPN